MNKLSVIRLVLLNDINICYFQQHQHPNYQHFHSVAHQPINQQLLNHQQTNQSINQPTNQSVHQSSHQYLKKKSSSLHLSTTFGIFVSLVGKSSKRDMREISSALLNLLNIC